MPQFTEETFAYEILLRFGEGDTTKGKLTGAHYQTITQVRRDGVIISSQIDTPRQLALVEGATGQMLSEVLGEVNAATIIQNQLLSANLTTERATTAALTESVAELQGRVASFTDSLSASQAEVRRLTDMLNAPVAELNPDPVAEAQPE